MANLELSDIEVELNEYYEARSCITCTHKDEDMWCFDCTNFRYYEEE